MRKILTLPKSLMFSILILTTSAQTFGQVRCPYETLEFKEIVPIWSQLLIDSSMIGYEYPLPTAVNFHEVMDGMTHLGYDEGSFIDNGYLYSLTDKDIGWDISGVLIDKIDLETGELVWRINDDIRNVEFREKPLEIYIVDDRLVIHGIRETLLDSHPDSIRNFSANADGFYYKREYDIVTGLLLDYVTPSDSDSLLVKLGFNESYNFNEDSIVRYRTRWNIFSSGTYIDKLVLDSLGRGIEKVDTVFEGFFQDRVILESILSSGNFFAKTPDDHFLRVEQFSPKQGFNHTYEAFLVEFDNEFNRVRTLDMKDYGLDSFSNLTIIDVTEDVVLLRACEYPFQFAFDVTCDRIYFILDRQFNLIGKFKNEINGTYVDLRDFKRSMLIRDRNDIYTSDSHFEDFSDSNYIKVFTNNTGGSVDLFYKFTLINDQWGGFIDRMFFLDDGDLLIKFIHGCILVGDNARNSTHHEWYRFSAEDLGNMTNIVDFKDQDILDVQLYPNPTLDQLTIAFSSLTPKALLIYDMNGNEVHNQSVEKGQAELVLNTESYVPGLYSATLVHINGQLTSHRFVKM